VGLLKLEKLLIIILMRPVVHPPPQLVELKSSSRVSVIKLKPLPESAIVDIIEYQWNLSCIPSSLQKKIFELSKGNPKFALDLFTTVYHH
jgi:predicted ATPase